MDIPAFQQRLASMHIDEYPAIFIAGKDYICDPITYEDLDAETTLPVSY